MAEQSHTSSHSSRFLFYENQGLVLGPKKKNLSGLTQNWQGPIYVYDLDFIKERFHQLQSALGGVKLFYAMKANPHPKILQLLKSLGAGIDVVSLGEIRRALENGFVASDVVYSGVGKTKTEITEALKMDLFQINVESYPELQRIAQIAESLGKKARVSLRLNPDVDIKTHPYIATGLRDNKFGIEMQLLPQLIQFFQNHSAHMELVGVSLHLGSQMLDFEGFREGLEKLKASYLELQSHFPSVRRFDFGGGLGIHYDRQDLNSELNICADYAGIVKEVLSDLGAELQSEPGRWLVAHAGVLLSQVQYVKQTSQKSFLVIDTGMNHLIRPALYESYHHVWALKEKAESMTVDIVGPICESADFIGKDRQMGHVSQDDFIVIQDAGAYGFSMASTYNLQDLPQEICI